MNNQLNLLDRTSRVTQCCLLKEVKRDLKRIHIDVCRYNERLNAKTEGWVTFMKVVYYESLKRELKTKPIYEFR